MRRIADLVVLMVLLTGSMLWSSVANADGALAVGIPGDVAELGTAYGISTNEASANAASATALANCRTMQNSGKEAQASCRVIGTFRNECVAIYEDPKAGTSGYGWAIAPTLQAAQAEAQRKCSATDGARRDFCELTLFGCDGTAN